MNTSTRTWMASFFWIVGLAYRQHPRITGHPPPIKRHLKRKVSTLAGAAASAGFCLLLAIDSAKEVYAANRTPEPGQIIRRDITDRNGTPIATSTPAFDLWLIPNQFWGATPANPTPRLSSAPPQTSDQQRRNQLLAAIESWPPLHAIVESRMNSYGKSDERQKILAWAIPPEVAGKITATDLHGLKLTPRPARHYPQGGLFAHILGFTSRADVGKGQEGLELAANAALVENIQPNRNQPSPPLQTTLDPEIQQAATAALNEGIATHGAVAGAAVVVEAATGKIRALVSAPGFDANDDSTYRNPYQPERILNRAQGINFPMGHLLTPLLAAHLIETGRMQATTPVAIGQQLTIGQHTIAEVSPTGTLSLSEIVAKSSNIGAAKLALGLPLAELRDVTRRLGIGMPLRIPGLTGNVDYESIDWEKWTPAMQADPGGQITTNLLQVTRAYLPLANGGKLARLSLLESAVAPVESRVLSAGTVNAMRDMLTQATGPTGTAPQASLPGLAVAGKTGTVIATGGSPVAAFIGMAPAAEPRWLIGILLQFPQHNTRLAGNTAAPAFAKLLAQITRLEKPQGSPVTANTKAKTG